MKETSRRDALRARVPLAAEDPPGELARRRAEARFHQRLRDLTVAFSRDVSSSRTLGSALEAFAADANVLIGGARTSIWLHHRRERELALITDSDDGRPPVAVRVPTDDPDAAPARGLRLEYPLIETADGLERLLVPLRGWRRALGTLVVDAPFETGLERDQLLDLGHELGRQLSAAVENIQLLEEILRQRRLLEDSFNSLVDLVVVTDSALRVVQMNDAFVDRVGLSRGELLERPIDTLVGARLASWIAASAPGTTPPVEMEDARTERFEDERLRGTFSVTITPLISGSGQPAGRVLVARDITEQARLEQEREALRQRLAQSEKLASLGQFVAGIAHEMNNPLQGVLGHLELLIETSQEAQPIRRDLRRIFQEADRAAKIVRNLLVFTGARRMSRRRLRLQRILSRALASRAAALTRAEIEVTRDEPDDLPWVSGDPLLLHQAFLNILINAEHATQLTRPPRRIAIRGRWSPSSPVVVTTIHDSGPGISAEALPRVFDPFFTTKDVGKGTGLGLAITYGIVQEHGGSIHATNAPDGGAVFTVELPALE